MEEQKNTADTENAKNVIEELPKGNTSENRIGFAAKFLHNITETAKNSINNMLQQSSQNTDKREISTSGTVIDTLCEKFNSLGIENDYLSTFLDKDARNELLSTLSKLPVSKALIMKITSGDATAKEVLTVIKNLIPLSDPETINELFRSQSFESIFSKVLESNWLLSPQKLKDGENINNFYNKMQMPRAE